MYSHTCRKKITQYTAILAVYCIDCTHWVKIRQVVGGALPAQEVLLWGVELQPDVQSKLQKQEGIQ